MTSCQGQKNTKIHGNQQHVGITTLASVHVITTPEIKSNQLVFLLELLHSTIVQVIARTPTLQEQDNVRTWYLRRKTSNVRTRLKTLIHGRVPHSTVYDNSYSTANHSNSNTIGMFYFFSFIYVKNIYTNLIKFVFWIFRTLGTQLSGKKK